MTIPIGEGTPPTARGGFALFAIGFRPLYLLAGVFAALAIAFWVAAFTGWVPIGGAVRSPLWHAHEMVFGYAFAVIVGFLFTAVRNWTGQPTPSGAALAAICALWVAGRVLAASPWPLVGAAADAAFALAAAAGIARPLLASGNRRNYFFIAALLGLGAAGVLFTLSIEGRLDLPLRSGLQVGLDLVLFVIVVMSGRVIPMFTANAVPGSKPRRIAWLERSALGSVLALLALDALSAPGAAIAAVAALACVAHAARLALWQPWRTRARPILWILHASYAWIAVHLALRSLAGLGLVLESLATHALTVGAIGGLTIGMMTRTARGHTGRALKASRVEVAAYILVLLAALVRVLGPLAGGTAYIPAIFASGALWTAAFALFLWRFVPILVRPRADGRPG